MTWKIAQVGKKGACEVLIQVLLQHVFLKGPMRTRASRRIPLHSGCLEMDREDEDTHFSSMPMFCLFSYK